MYKFYEMCKKGVRIAMLQICTNFNDNDMMIETFIKLMRISQTKVGFTFYSLKVIFTLLYNSLLSKFIQYLPLFYQIVFKY